jgi:hypothetical protein
VKYKLSILLVIFIATLVSQNQNDKLSSFNAASLIPASVTNNKLEVKTKVWPITLERQGNSVSKIILLRAGVLEEIYQPDVPSFPSYFYTSDNRLCFINDVFVYYKMNSGTPSISYVLADNTDKLNNCDVSKLSSSMVDYFAMISNEQRTAKESFKGDLAAVKEKEKLANSLKGKNIKSLEIVWLTDEAKTGMQSKIQFGVKATDVSGKVFSTDNLGGKTAWEDFIISSKGAIAGDEYLTVDTDGSKIQNDMVYLNVKNKYLPSLETNSSIKLAYNTPVKLSYPGKNGCPPLISGTGTRGGGAPDAELNVCNSNDNKYVLIEVKIGGTTLHRLKLNKEVPFYLDVTGGGGCSGRSEKTVQGGKGGDAGNGGDVTVNKDLKLAGDNLNIYNSGGRGGKGGKGKPLDGPNGSDGNSGIINYNSKSIQLNY